MSHKNKKEIIYRRATGADIDDIRFFVDFWLAGRAKNKGIENAGNDYFVTKKQHEGYIKGSIVLLGIMNGKIVGWGVKGQNNVLFHLLVGADSRGLGIGSSMLKTLNPDIIRSKSDQQTGDPAPFYEAHGYSVYSPSFQKVGKKDNIDLMVKNRK